MLVSGRYSALREGSICGGINGYDDKYHMISAGLNMYYYA